MSRLPRVGVNLLWLVPGVVGGSEEYTVRLLGALADRAAGRVEVVLFVNRLAQRAHPRLLEQYEHVVAPIVGSAKARRVAAENSWLAVAARRLGVDLVHHMGGIEPFLVTTPTVLTIHDLQPLALPEHFTPTKRSFHRVVLPWSVRRAGHIVTLTEFTRTDLHRRLGVDPARVTVVPSGVETGLPPVDAAVVASVRARYGVADCPYFLYPAITYPHKNHEVLIAALDAVRRRVPGARLVLTGGVAQREMALAAQARRLGLLGAVVRTGRIPAADLDALYRGAVALTFPSTFEGFGLPVLEAMARACPVIAADATALPEVVGDAGMLLAPDDPAAWADAMVTLVESPGRAAALAAGGKDRAQLFSWADAASTLERVWQESLA